MRRIPWVVLWSLLLAVPAPRAAAQQAQPKAAAKPPAVQHDLEGRAQCLMCHAAGVMEAVPDVPATHKSYTEQACLWCHAKGAAIQTVDAPAIPHALEGRDACMMCHQVGAMEAVPDAPADHKDRPDKLCTICHSPAPKK